jgi:hypothetical protein
MLSQEMAGKGMSAWSSLGFVVSGRCGVQCLEHGAAAMLKQGRWARQHRSLGFAVCLSGLGRPAGLPGGQGSGQPGAARP